MSNDMDHPHFDPQPGPNLRSHFPITIHVTIWTISAMTSLTRPPPVFIICNNKYIQHAALAIALHDPTPIMLSLLTP